MKTRKMNVVDVPLAEMRPYENNPRVNGASVESLARLIETLGFRNPALINGEKTIIEGHTRWLACRHLGWKTMPCIIATDLTPEQERALRIADNRVSEIAEWDEEKLKVEMAALQEAGIDLSLLAFDDEAVSRLLDDGGAGGANADPDAVPETPETPSSVPGEVYRLGDHLLCCGDSTKPVDVRRVCGDGEADLWLTDPPYNVDYHGAGGMTIRNDSMTDAKFREFLRSAFTCARNALRPGGAFYVFHADSEGFNFRDACAAAGLRVRQCLVWKKNTLVLGRQDYHWMHEPCLYGWRDGAERGWFAAEPQASVLEYAKPSRNKVHPTMKPVEMLERLVRNSTRGGEVVLDTFGGSGSTLMACERTGRVCRCVELDPKYCDVIRRRWAEYVHGEGCDWRSLTPSVAAGSEDGNRK